MGKVKFLMLFIIMTASGFDKAYAYDDEFYRGAIESFEKAIKPHIFRAVDPSHRRLLQNIPIELVERVDLPTLALTGSKPPKIYISLGFLDGLFQHIDCFLLEVSVHGASPETCHRYFRYFFHTAIRPDIDYPKAIARLLFANHEGSADRWYRDPDIKKSRELMFMASLTSIIMHEYGHHITGFAPKGASISDLRRAEVRADRWSQETLHAIGESPLLGTMISMGYLSRMEQYRADLADEASDDPDFYQVTSAHPDPEKRVRWTYETYCGNAQNNSVIQACRYLSSQIRNFE